MAATPTKPKRSRKPVSSPYEPQVLDLERLRKKGVTARQSRETTDKHAYFAGVSEARYVLRKVFRIVEEQAKEFDIDPLAHQALIQIYGSPDMRMQVNQVAARLDIAPAFASSLVRALVEKGFVTREPDERDKRIIYVAVTDHGRSTLSEIDERVKFHVDYFTGQLSKEQRESALSILMFYVGAKL
jgi:DNA-binding MarR family transcriptional regulator